MIEWDAWLRLASHLKMSLWRVRRETGSYEFLVWLEWLRQKDEAEAKAKAEQEWKRHHRIDYYLAQINTTLKRMFSKNPRAITLESSLLTFELSNDPKPKKKVSKRRREKEFQKRADASKRTWLGMFGFLDKLKKKG